MSFLKDMWLRSSPRKALNIYYITFHYREDPEHKYTTRVDAETEKKARKGAEQTARKKGGENKPGVIDSVELMGTTSGGVDSWRR